MKEKQNAENKFQLQMQQNKLNVEQRIFFIEITKRKEKIQMKIAHLYQKVLCLMMIKKKVRA